LTPQRQQVVFFVPAFDLEFVRAAILNRLPVVAVDGRRDRDRLDW
jgi:hypothetical protein